MDELGDKAMSQVYIWGQTGNHQLGVESGELGYLTEPTQLLSIENSCVRLAAIGSTHSLLLTDKGLLSAGCNSHGQLGRNTSGDATVWQPDVVDGVPHNNIVAIAVGEMHSLALTDDGKVYSWGCNESGQLGRSQSTSIDCVQFPVTCHVTDIACGEYHNIALTKDGAVYTWGSNQYGQLGHGHINGAILNQPKYVQSIRSLHFIKISAGGNHSFALTISGAPFGWGRNSNGQLGIATTEDKPFPVCCRALRHQRVKHVSCGLNHTAALTKDGGVFTFGAGHNGQLGHSISQDECLPKKVMELMGSIVTQLSCGRFHTLSFVPSSGRVYACGLSAYGQLGTGDVDKKTTPSQVKPTWSSGVTNSSPSFPHFVCQIAAGGNSSLVLVHPEPSSASSIDQRHMISKHTRLDEEFINIVTRHPAKAKLESSVESLISDIFQNISIWNGAFLTNSAQHGVDLDLAREQLSRISTCTNTVIKQLIPSKFEQYLGVYLKGKIPDVEALRIFLILPFLPIFANPDNFATVHILYGNALVTMDPAACKVIDKWLLRVPRRHFKYYLLTFKSVISHILLMRAASTEYAALMRQQAIQICLNVMKRLYDINETEDEEEKVSCVDFYIPEIATKVDIKRDYCNWLSHSQTDRSGQALVNFCHYVFTFDAQAKTILLHTDALFQMQQAIDHAHRLNLYHIFSSAEIDPIHPCLVINVSRENIVHDTLVAVNNHGSADLKKPLKVQFRNEEAVDEGGVRKEFFLLVIKEVLDVKYGMFRFYEDTRLLWFNSTTFEDDMSMYRLIGLLCGLAIYNITIIDLPFPLALYKKLLGKPVNLDDMRELDPVLGKSLQDLLDYDGDDVADVFCLNYSMNVNVLDEVVAVDLIPNGSEVAVTNDNRQEYVHHYVSYVFNDSVKKMFDAFSDGFHKVCGSKVLSCFHPVELQTMVVGNENYDWEQLQKNCEYKGEYYEGHPTIAMFWEVFHELSESHRKKFLRFLTGCDRIPPQGMQSLMMAMQPMHTPDDHLPVAHTCFNLLDLPIYSSKDILHTKLLAAIEYAAEGFGLV